MLRIFQRSDQIISKSQRFQIIFSNSNYRHFRSSIKCDDKNINRQIKVMGKLFGKRVAGSKRKWYPSEMQHITPLPTVAGLGNHKKRDGKNSTRRMTVLNKLFMKSVTDLLATGAISQEIVGKGLEISKVKITPDFQTVNVFWIAKGDLNDNELDNILRSCTGLIRHELSQLRLMGEVPRINFVKDKTFANLAEVENLLKKCDFGEDYVVHNILTNEVCNDLHLEPFENVEQLLPDMRHDVLGLDHQNIMMKILTKMKKSKNAWNLHEQLDLTKEQSLVNISGEDAISKLKKKNEEDSSDRFEKFLNKRTWTNSSLKNTTKYSEDILEQSDVPYEDEIYYDGRNEGDFVDEYDKNGKK